MIKLRVRKGDHPEVTWVGCSFNRASLWDREEEKPREDKDRLEGFGHNPVNAWSHQKLEEAGRTFHRAFSGSLTRWHLDVRLLASTAVRDQISVVSSFQVCKVICYVSPGTEIPIRVVIRTLLQSRLPTLGSNMQNISKKLKISNFECFKVPFLFHSYRRWMCRFGFWFPDR